METATAITFHFFVKIGAVMKQIDITCRILIQIQREFMMRTRALMIKMPS